eukprot:10173933-Heterocapsa_arctica.AAC.1
MAQSSTGSAHWSMGSAADGRYVLEHDSPYEERQGTLQQLHDQVLAKDEPGPRLSNAQRRRGGGPQQEVRWRSRHAGR